MNAQRQTPGRILGFTLIEVLVAVVIVGILAAFAVPSYTSYVQKTRRADATTYLQEVAGEQYRFYSENNRYATKLSDLGYADKTREGWYSVTLSDLSDTGFVLTATPTSDGLQAHDSDCGAFTINSSNATNATGPLGTDCW